MDVLVIGRNQRRVELQINKARAEFEDSFTFHVATSHVSMREVFETNDVDIVIMSGGHEADEKAHFVDYIIKASPSTSIHIKDSNSGHKGMVLFIKGLLACPFQGGQLRDRVATTK